MEYRIHFTTANAAFADGNAGAEAARILRQLADACEHAAEPVVAAIYDINGNKVGEVQYE